MSKEENKGEGAKKEDEKNNEEKDSGSAINLTAESAGEDNSQNGKTLDEFEQENDKDKKIKNLLAATVVLAGLFVGSLFVDVVQFITKSGYSEHALRSTEVFELGDKTWVAYSEPAIETKVLVAESEEDCPECNPDQVLEWMRKFMPTMVIDKVSASSREGENLIENYNLKTIPSFTFGKEIKEADFFKQGQVSQVFEEKENGYVLNSAALGVPVGKYLKSPEILEKDALIGSPKAEEKVVVFSDFQCPYSKNLYDAVKETVDEFGEDKVAFVYKDMPLEFHAQAENAALAAQCANEQGNFRQMADLLFDNQETWSETEGKQVFKGYASQIGLSAEDFNNCLEEEKFKEKIQNSLELGKSYGVAGTPATFVGQEFLNGAVEKAELKKAIEDQLNKEASVRQDPPAEDSDREGSANSPEADEGDNAGGQEE
ncbi:MAG: thioredoxin domain-containing protein [Candidatus Moranbacteria bacterium]|nr:thioredoxin domain-containing protein [Candidatus Moranbacteria bacterium]